LNKINLGQITTADGESYYTAQFNDLPHLCIVFEMRSVAGCKYFIIHLFDESEHLSHQYYDGLVHVFLANNPLPLELFRSADGLNGVLVVHSRALPEKISASSIWGVAPDQVVSLQWGTKFVPLISRIAGETARKFNEEKSEVVGHVVEAFNQIIQQKLHKCNDYSLVPGFIKQTLENDASRLFGDYKGIRRKKEQEIKCISLDDTVHKEKIFSRKTTREVRRHEITESPIAYAFWRETERAFLINRFTAPAKRIVAGNYYRYKFAHQHRANLKQHGIILTLRRVQQIIREVEQAQREAHSWAIEFDQEIDTKRNVEGGVNVNQDLYDTMSMKELALLFDEKPKKSFRFSTGVGILYSKGQFFYDH
jgi:hypothetical protein